MLLQRRSQRTTRPHDRAKNTPARARQMRSIVGSLQAASGTRLRRLGLGGGWGSTGTTGCRGGLLHPRRKSWIALTPYPSARTPQAIAETVILLRALRVPLRQASRSGPEPPPAGASCTTRSCTMHEDSPRALLGTSSHLFFAALLSPPARNEREPARSRPGRDDDFRCRSSAAVPAARPRHTCSRFPHRVPVVDEVQDDEPDEGADVDEHGPTGKQRPGHGRPGYKVNRFVTDRRTQSGELHERALQDATSDGDR